MAQLHHSLERHHDHKQLELVAPDLMIDNIEIEYLVRKLNAIALRLQAGTHPFLCALGRAIILFLYLSWPADPNVYTPLLAHDLCRALKMSQIRLCSTIDFLVWKFFVGGVAAMPRSEDRIWFVGKLAKLMPTIPIDTWGEVLDILKRAFLPDRVVLGKMKGVWEEVQAIRGEEYPYDSVRNEGGCRSIDIG